MYISVFSSKIIFGKMQKKVVVMTICALATFSSERVCMARRSDHGVLIAGISLLVLLSEFPEGRRRILKVSRHVCSLQAHFPPLSRASLGR